MTGVSAPCKLRKGLLLDYPDLARPVRLQKHAEVVAATPQRIASTLVAIQYRQHPLDRAARRLNGLYRREQRTAGRANVVQNRHAAARLQPALHLLARAVILGLRPHEEGPQRAALQAGSPAQRR